MHLPNLFTSSMILVAPLVSAAAVPCKTLKVGGAVKYYRRSPNLSRDHDTALADIWIEYGGKRVCDFTGSAGERIWQQNDPARIFQGRCSNRGYMKTDVDGKWAEYKEPGGKVHTIMKNQFVVKGKEDKQLMTTIVFGGWTECKADNGWRM